MSDFLLLEGGMNVETGLLFALFPLLLLGGTNVETGLLLLFPFGGMNVATGLLLGCVVCTG